MLVGATFRGIVRDHERPAVKQFDDGSNRWRANDDRFPIGHFTSVSFLSNALIWMVAGAESNHRHADFQSFFGDSRGLSINHLQRLRAPSPASPRHNHGTPSLSRSRSWHKGLRIAVKPEQDRKNNRDRGQRHVIYGRGPCSDPMRRTSPVTTVKVSAYAVTASRDRQCAEMPVRSSRSDGKVLGTLRSTPSIRVGSSKSWRCSRRRPPLTR